MDSYMAFEKEHRIWNRTELGLWKWLFEQAASSFIDSATICTPLWVMHKAWLWDMMVNKAVIAFAFKAAYSVAGDRNKAHYHTTK